MTLDLATKTQDNEKKYKIPGSEYLAKLETFDPNAFLSDDKEEQKVCNFVLALCVAYNDLKDLLWARVHLTDAHTDTDVEGKDRITPYNGQYAGFRIHIEKLLFSFINELLCLIREQKQVLEDAALNKDTDDDFLKKHVRLRNITYHYKDYKTYKIGFEKFFFDENKSKIKDPFISRGANMAGTRFYFADAAVQGYITSNIEGNEKEFADKTAAYLTTINKILYEICTKFINIAKGCGWKPHTD
jgi:hypothetical protein